MRSTTRSLAIAAGVLLLPAAAATPVLAQADGDAPSPGMAHMHQQMTDGTDMNGAGMTRMHDRMMTGDHAGMTHMHDRMMTGDHAGVTHMHDRMMTEEPGAHSQPETTP